MNFSIEAGTICSYGKMLAAEERSAGTIEKYLRDVRAFASWLGGRALNKEETAGWKQHLLAQGYTPVTVNSMLSALNRFFSLHRPRRMPGPVFADSAPRFPRPHTRFGAGRL